MICGELIKAYPGGVGVIYSRKITFLGIFVQNIFQFGSSGFSFKLCLLERIVNIYFYINLKYYLGIVIAINYFLIILLSSITWKRKSDGNQLRI